MSVDLGLAGFQEWLVGAYSSDAIYERVEAITDPSRGLGDLSVRLHVANRSYYEVRVDLAARELQVGFATEHRMVNESIEQSILDSGSDLDELLHDELSDLGEEPVPMQHFYERPAFRFTTRLPLPSLDDPAVRKRVKAIIQACSVLFQQCVDEA